MQKTVSFKKRRVSVSSVSVHMKIGKRFLSGRIERSADLERERSLENQWRTFEIVSHASHAGQLQDEVTRVCRLITMSETRTNTFPKLSIAYTRTVCSNQKLEAYQMRALTLCVLSSTCNYSRGYAVTPINEYTTCERHRVE